MNKNFSKVNEEILADIRNKLTVPKTALGKIANGEQVPKAFLDLAVQELGALERLLKQLDLSHSDNSDSPQNPLFFA